MPNNGDNNEGNERRIRDMLGLVKFCLETTSNEDHTSESPVNPEAMDPDRRAWLQQAISSMTVDTTQQLLENLALVKETITQMEKDQNHDIPVQKTCNAIEVLTDLCEEIDYASDFAKLDGFSIFKPLIGCPHEEMTVKACELIAALAQNNPLCQSLAVQSRLLERLIDYVHIKEDQSHIKARSYALYAISSIIRCNQEVRTRFESQLEGLPVLLHLLDYQHLDKMLDTKSSASKEDNKSPSVYWWRKLRIRSIFLFRTLCDESESASRFFYDKQAIKQLTNQLSNCHDAEIREHLLHALKAFILSFDKAMLSESLRIAPNLKDVVVQIYESSLQRSNDDCDLSDTKSTCKDVLKLID